MIEVIRRLPPHDTKETVSMNEARTIVFNLNKPMANILKHIDQTKQECEKTKEVIESAKCDHNELAKALKFKGYDLECTRLKNPIVVCNHCASNIKVGEEQELKQVFEKTCCGKCWARHPSLCKKFKFVGPLGGNCSKCGHHISAHHNSKFRYTTVEREFLNDDVRSKIKVVSPLFNF